MDTKNTDIESQRKEAKKRTSDKENLIQAIYYIDRLNRLTARYKSAKDFLAEDELLKDGVTLGIQTICEYANKTSNYLQKKYNDIDWKGVCDQRNKIAHDYGNVSYKSIWITYKQEIPYLRDYLCKVLKEEFDMSYDDLNTELSLPKVKKHKSMKL